MLRKGWAGRIVALLLACALSTSAAFSQTVKVSGSVRGIKDGKEDKVVGGSVWAINGKGARLGTAKDNGIFKTNDTGGYEFSFDRKEVETPSYTVLFAAAGFHVTRIEKLAGKENEQKISPILSDVKGPKEFIDILNQIDTYEFFHNQAASQKDSSVEVQRVVTLLQPLVKSMPHPLVHTTSATPEQTSVIQKNLSEGQKTILIRRYAALYALYGIPDPSVVTVAPCETYVAPARRHGLFRRR